MHLKRKLNMNKMTVLLVEPISKHAILRMGACCMQNQWSAHWLMTRSNKLKEVTQEFGRVISFDSLNQSVEEVFKIICDEKYDAIVPASEFAVPMAEALAQRIGLYHNPLEIVSCYRDKSKMRKLFSQYGISQPSMLYELTSESQIAEINWEALEYPVVAKPAEAAGSVLVRICDTVEEVKVAVRDILGFRNSRVTSLSFSPKAVVEQAVLGPEYSAEIVINHDEIVHRSITVKVLSKPPFCDEVGHIVGSDLPAHILSMVDENIEKIKTAYSVRNGVLHAEFKVRNGQIYFIEVGARIAGDMISELVELTYGLSMEEAFILSRAGKDVPVNGRHADKLHGIRFIFDEKDVERLENAAFITPTNIDYRVDPGVLRSSHGFSERRGHAIFSADMNSVEKVYDLIAG